MPPTSMRVVQAVAYGGPDVLQSADRPVPAPRPDEVLVAVLACGLGAWDLKRRAGAFGRDPSALPIVLGTELCGIVEAVGDRAAGVAVGDRVYGYAPDGSGANAERAIVSAAALAPVPAGLSDAEAAAAPVGVLTAWQALVEALALQAGETLVVTGAAGGMGSFAVQTGRALGARVIATSAAKDLAGALELGANDAVDGRGDWVRAVKALVPGGADAVLDCVGADVAARAPAAIRDGGRLVTLIPGAEPPAERGIASASFATRADGAQLRELAERLERGELRVALADTLPLAQAREAHERLEAGGVGGKLALTISH